MALLPLLRLEGSKVVCGHLQYLILLDEVKAQLQVDST